MPEPTQGLAFIPMYKPHPNLWVTDRENISPSGDHQLGELWGHVSRCTMPETGSSVPELGPALARRAEMLPLSLLLREKADFGALTGQMWGALDLQLEKQGMG